MPRPGARVYSELAECSVVCMNVRASTGVPEKPVFGFLGWE
jgi:hypothetical protein